MKKIFLLFLIAIFTVCISSCSSTQPAPQESATEQTDKAEHSDNNTDAQTPQLHDMLSDTFYAGRVTEITPDSLTIILDETETVSYKLNDKARRDIDTLGVAVDTRVIVTFEKNEDGSLTATSVDVITSE